MSILDGDERWWLVFAYSDWLDAEKHLVKGDDDGDGLTHEGLVDEFFREGPKWHEPTDSGDTKPDGGRTL